MNIKYCTFILVMNIIKITTTVLFAVYLLTVSCGFTLSHVHCSKGEQWVIGSEMPPCKRPSEVKSSCCDSENKRADVTQKNNDKREKNTYNFKFDLEGKEVSTLDTDFTSHDLLFCPTPLTNSIDLLQRKAPKSHFFEFHPPPDLLKPDLIKLQVFLI